MKPSDISILQDLMACPPVSDRNALLANIAQVIARYEPSEPAPIRRFREAVQALETHLSPPGHAAMEVFTSPIADLAYRRLPDLLRQLASSQGDAMPPSASVSSAPPVPPVPPASVETPKPVRRKAAAIPSTPDPAPPPPLAPPPPPPPPPLPSETFPASPSPAPSEKWGVSEVSSVPPVPSPAPLAPPSPALPVAPPPPKASPKRAAKTNDEIHIMLCELMAAVHASYALLARAALDPSFTPPETLPPPSSFFTREPR